METTKCEKYLTSQSGKNRENVKARRAKGFGLSSEILSVLEEVPLGRYRIEIGLKLRQAMFINGILYNSEAWENITEEE